MRKPGNINELIQRLQELVTENPEIGEWIPELGSESERWKGRVTPYPEYKAVEIW